MRRIALKLKRSKKCLKEKSVLKSSVVLTCILFYVNFLVKAEWGNVVVCKLVINQCIFCIVRYLLKLSDCTYLYLNIS